MANDDDDEWTVVIILTADPPAVDAAVDDLHAAVDAAPFAVVPAAVDAAPPVAPEHDIHGDGVDDEKIYYYWDDDFHSRLQSDIHRD